jgi:hypothetical protein
VSRRESLLLLSPKEIDVEGEVVLRETFKGPKIVSDLHDWYSWVLLRVRMWAHVNFQTRFKVVAGTSHTARINLPSHKETPAKIRIFSFAEYIKAQRQR